MHAQSRRTDLLFRSEGLPQCHSRSGITNIETLFYSLIAFAEMDMVERILREATTKSKDGRIDQAEFLNYASQHSRYSLFTPMEVSIIFHFAGRGHADQRLALPEFGQLLDARWQSPHKEQASSSTADVVTTTLLQDIAHSAYNFVQGGQIWNVLFMLMMG